jgi:hypothetical protein
LSEDEASGLDCNESNAGAGKKATVDDGEGTASMEAKMLRTRETANLVAFRSSKTRDIPETKEGEVVSDRIGPLVMAMVAVFLFALREEQQICCRR